jgi:hypothetical protein
MLKADGREVDYVGPTGKPVRARVTRVFAADVPGEDG